MGGRSEFCWSCGSDLRRNKPPRIVGNYCVRADDEFAVRVDPEDVSGFLKQSIVVEPGTVGLVDRGGRITKLVEEGSQTLEGIFQLRGPVSIYLISATDAVLRPTFTRLSDAKGAELDVTLHAVLRVGNHESFVRHYFEKRRRRVTYQMLEESVIYELQDVLSGLVNKHPIEEMYGNLAWRGELEKDIRDAMTASLLRFGLELVQVNFVEFGGEDFETFRAGKREVNMSCVAADHLAEQLAVRKRVAELAKESKLSDVSGELELAHKVRELNNQYGIKAVLSDSELEETVKQARHEQTLKDKMRALELTQLDQETQMELERVQREYQLQVEMSVLVARNNRDATESEFRREQERLGNTHVLKIEWDRSEQRRGNDLADAETNAKRLLITARAETQARIEELTAKQAEGKLAQDDLDRMQTREIEMAERLVRLKIQEREVELAYKRFEKEKDSEVSIAGIRANVEIATAQATTEAAVGKTEAALLKDILKSTRDDSARHEENLIRMGTGRPQPTVVVGAGGVATRIPVSPDEAAPATSPCPNCGRPVELTDDFCGNCGHNMKQSAR